MPLRCSSSTWEPAGNLCSSTAAARRCSVRAGPPTDDRSFLPAETGTATLGSGELLRVDPETGKVTAVPPGTKGNPLGGFAWSGEGRELFYIQSASSMGDVSGSESRIYRCDARTGRRGTLLWADGLTTVNGTEGGVSYCDVLSPGRLLIGRAKAPAEPARGDLRSDGSAGSPFTGRDGGSSLTGSRRIRPTADGFSFSSNRNGNLDLWLIDLSTGSLRQVTDDTAQDWDPGFTPDGKHILWDSDRGGHLEVWIASIDGSAARQVTHDGSTRRIPPRRPMESGSCTGAATRPAGVWKVHPDGSGAAGFERTRWHRRLSRRALRAL